MCLSLRPVRGPVDPAGIALALHVSRGHKQVSPVRLGLGLMIVISCASFRRNLTTDDDSRANFAQYKWRMLQGTQDDHPLVREQ